MDCRRCDAVSPSELCSKESSRCVPVALERREQDGRIELNKRVCRSGIQYGDSVVASVSMEDGEKRSGRSNILQRIE
ncbi:uncharacterized protein LACBIDRAFT_305096 [Laccaria bicolor S238N-H82]|uniref:Predicted protein n=1 Tax=Laccaria bicolor (strain S238N-H82 / ATCC MYA-4686) TaxID=486041 RepID=B0CTE6_LACBS|nr:uncharacterized protein LACBIDRAFT_305096 [Laccaria bicolor S238N-H82]EDR13905.1 predicted protein [Laccaria bicolor S238N-H82]|eukprot:XP_001874464.1 predicted protein [Laccaria bicolor S238N-H82]